ncbi:hypothetical protein BKA00_005930 [Actinomadura coerulea]|uniref:Uncharacterized protein n=1 Tax=Actinomadura coerulea TaxID=46159 RepID=A0A7X0L1T7_9ACTN|nr:hypothetical protein [Actinomadura coerulea]MBB6399016.1 hypothetical protein [Actinomadura coerulea]GGP97602.1 hypothetical protein GCM10010187_11340 [Actinomadura coerulea]
MSEIHNILSGLSTDYLPIRVSGVEITWLDYLKAWCQGIDKIEYARARQAGAAHAEVLEANAFGYLGLREYAWLRQAGGPHAETLEAVARRVDPVNYAMSRRVGASHTEALEAHDKRIDLFDYATARARTATHAEALDAHAQGVNLFNYANARQYEGSRTHEQALEICLKRIPLWTYLTEMHGRPDASHAEIVEAILASAESERLGE